MKQRDAIVFVCTGNTCRSPMAEGLFKFLVQQHADFPYKILSAGISAWAGEPASPHAVEALREWDIDISQHQSQPLTQSLLDRTFALFCMTHGHHAVVSVTFDLPPHCMLLRSLIPHVKDLEVVDPYGQNLDMYRLTRDHIQVALPHILHYVVDNT